MSQIVLETRGLTKSFGANVAVSDVSLSVETGRIHCIIGPNGAGKTTLFNLLTKDLQPSSGTIVLAGHDITSLKPHEISRRGVGRSYQITSIFPHMSVRDNVWVATYRHRRGGQFNFWSRSGAYPDVDARANEILAEIGVGAAYDRTPAGELSYGDQRLLEIAIALATSPRLLLFDEPMSGLSEEETRRVAELIRALGARYTVVMIEHKMNVVMTISDRITVMNFGKVIADGPPVEIAADAAVKRAYFGT